MQCPSRVCTAHAAGGFIRDCLAAASHCRYAVAFADHNCRYAIYYRRLAADHRCRYAVSAVATLENTAAAGRCRKFITAHPSHK